MDPATVLIGVVIGVIFTSLSLIFTDFHRERPWGEQELSVPHMQRVWMLLFASVVYWPAAIMVAYVLGGALWYAGNLVTAESPVSEPAICTCVCVIDEAELWMVEQGESFVPHDDHPDP